MLQYSQYTLYLVGSLSKLDRLDPVKIGTTHFCGPKSHQNSTGPKAAITHCQRGSAFFIAPFQMVRSSRISENRDYQALKMLPNSRIPQILGISGSMFPELSYPNFKPSWDPSIPTSCCASAWASDASAPLSQQRRLSRHRRSRRLRRLPVTTGRSLLLGASHTWWFIPLSKWVITPVISGLTLLIPFITGVITQLLSGMNHQVDPKKEQGKAPICSADFINLVKFYGLCLGI